MWNGLCVYTANANGNSALCNIPINSHSWQKPPQPDPGFICAKVVAVQNSVPAFPKGFELIQKMWNGACNYAGAASNSNKALCNIPLTVSDARSLVWPLRQNCTALPVSAHISYDADFSAEC